MNRKSGVVAAAALLSGAAVWVWRRSTAASAAAGAQARPLARWENEGGAPAGISANATSRRNKRRMAEASNSEAVGSTPDAWVFPRA